MVHFPLIATVVLTAVAANPQAELACGQRDDVLAQLSERYRESPVAIGLTRSGGVVELLTADTGTTWTLIITAPNGSSCILVEGEEWQPRRRARAEGPGA